MNIDGLTAALIEWLQDDVLENVQLPSEGRGARVAPQVYDSFLPPKRYDDPNKDTDFPFILVRPFEGAQDIENRLVTVDLVIGARRELDGHKDVRMLIDLISRRLFERPRLGVFSFQWDLSWTIPAEQNDPFYHGQITTVWAIPNPETLGDGHV